MQIHELSDAECRAILKRGHLARLACSRNDQPYIVPVHYDFDGGALYSFSMLGQKIDWMRSNPKVCLEVDEITDKSEWTTVVVFGRYQELTDSSADSVARSRARELFEKRPEWWYPAAGKTQGSERHVPIVYRIRVERLSGRRAKRPMTAP
jgi:nitroimidazol reductase NimA-like FMN-containing flavoprotein (pyridoxamine 5'-phosphate oxidase superfamily)